MKPSNVTIELSEKEIETIIQEWAQREYPNDAVVKVTLGTFEYGDCLDNTIGIAVSASVRMTPNKTKT